MPNSFEKFFARTFPARVTFLGPVGDFVPTVIPDTVTGLTATAGNQEVSLAWNSALNAQEYKIYRSTASPVTTSDTLVATVTGAAYTDTGRTNGTEYFYAVLASNVVGDAAALSNEDSATPIIGVPQSVAASADTPTEIDVTWDAVTGATAYDLYHSTTSPVDKLDTKITGATSPQTITGLTNGTEVFAAVAARDAATESALSAEASSMPLATVSDLAASAGDTQITLTWSTVTGATAYDIYRSTSPSVTLTPGNLLASDASSGYVDTGLTNGTAYYYAINARRDATSSESGLGNEDSATPVISTPASLSIDSGTTGELTLSWDAVTGATNYQLYRSTTSPVTTSDTLAYSGTGTGVTDTGLVDGTTYYYAVRAQDAASNSALSAEDSGAPIAAPVISSVEGGNEQNTITWGAVTGATSYDLYFATTTGVTSGTGTKLTGVTSPYVHTGLTNDTTYYYVAVANYALGNSDDSAEANGTPVAGLSQTHWLDLERDSSQYASITDAAQNGVLDITTSFTIEMRIKPESVGISQYLCCKSSSGQELFEAYIAFTDKPQFTTWNASGQQNSWRTSGVPTPLATAGNEFHIAFVQDLSGSGSKKILIDGVEQTITFTANNDDTTLRSGTTSPFEIGALAGANTFDGYIADVRVWNVARSTAQINDNKAKNLDPASEANLIFHAYKSNDHTDETSNANDLTASGSPVFVAYDGTAYT